MNPKVLNVIVGLLVVLLVIAAGWIVWDKFNDSQRMRVLEDEKKRVFQYIDSLKDVRVEIAEKKALWIIVDKERKDSLQTALIILNAYQRKYEKLRTAPVVRYNEPQLDSIIGVIIRRHYPAVSH